MAFKIDVAIEIDEEEIIGQVRRLVQKVIAERISTYQTREKIVKLINKEFDTQLEEACRQGLMDKDAIQDMVRERIEAKIKTKLTRLMSES